MNDFHVDVVVPANRPILVIIKKRGQSSSVTRFTFELLESNDLQSQMLLVTMSHLSQRLARHLCTWVGSCTLVGLLVHGGGKYFSNCQYLKTFEGLVHHLGQRTILVSAEITWRDHNPDLGKAITFWNHSAKWTRSRFACATRVYDTEKKSHAWNKRGKIHLHVSRQLFVLFIYFRHWFNFL